MVKETVLVEAGDLLTHVYRPHSGAISMMVRLSGGGRWRWRRSDVTASSAPRPLSTAGNRLTSAVVVLPGTASVLDAADFRAAAHPSVTFRAMVARQEQALLATTRQSACNVSRSVEARLSRWQLRARDLCGGEALPLTQETLAQMIGVQRNAISIVAHALQQAGMIRCSRGYIDIANASGLKELACGCYRAVHARIIGACSRFRSEASAPMAGARRYLRDDAPRNEAVQEDAPICQFFLPMMRAGLKLYIKYRA